MECRSTLAQGRASNSWRVLEFHVVVLILLNASRVKSWPTLKLMMGGSCSTGWGFPWVGLKRVWALMMELKVRARKKVPWLYTEVALNSWAKRSCMLPDVTSPNKTHVVPWKRVLALRGQLCRSAHMAVRRGAGGVVGVTSEEVPNPRVWSKQSFVWR